VAGIISRTISRAAIQILAPILHFVDWLIRQHGDLMLGYCLYLPVSHNLVFGAAFRQKKMQNKAIRGNCDASA
jgi:hypothetical protein